MKKTPAEMFREGRRAKGMKQAEAADALKVNRIWICKVESGAAKPSLEKMREMSNLYGMNLSGEVILQAYADWITPDSTLTSEEKQLLSAFRHRDIGRAMKILSAHV